MKGWNKMKRAVEFLNNKHKSLLPSEELLINKSISKILSNPAHADDEWWEIELGIRSAVDRILEDALINAEFSEKQEREIIRRGYKEAETRKREDEKITWHGKVWIPKLSIVPMVIVTMSERGGTVTYTRSDDDEQFYWHMPIKEFMGRFDPFDGSIIPGSLSKEQFEEIVKRMRENCDKIMKKENIPSDKNEYI